jgi:hypothetical protein
MFNVFFVVFGCILIWCFGFGVIKWVIMVFFWFGLVVLLDVVIFLLLIWFIGEGLLFLVNFML